MFAGKKSAQIREILISESAWEEMTCLFAPSLDKYSVDKTTPIETLYLLVLIRQLGKYYWLGEKSLMKYFNIS
ncbi:hypothetical protein ACMGL1_28945, partial [Enterobacter cloacae]